MKSIVGVLCALWAGHGVDAAPDQVSVSPERMNAIYEEVKTPYKAGMELVPEDGEMLDNPMVFRHGKSWYMMFIRFDGKGYETHLAMSDDLMKWKRLGRIFSRGEKGAWDPSRSCGGRFVNFYNAKQRGVWRETIGMAVSDDMLHWRRVGDGPVVENGTPAQHCISGDPTVRRINDVWVMFYFGYKWKRGVDGAFDTFACSYDLKHWTKWEGEPLVKPSERYDCIHAHKPWVLKHDGVVYHWYCAVGKLNGREVRGIALATSVPKAALPR